ncbi:DNA-binding protein WhiA [uncultured Faecalibaculum sp.]|uniref:DNA-binding protein WhiA n=1 Tax=uncultured Faecalibaculum sp. TaxID=1729681 RepID=UPI002628599D|nr:DNA-binding protein WhiA [uncultured Faecalibaculum sp.]
MSFTYDVKQEISGAQLDDRQASAQLAALLLVKATLHMNSHGTYLSFQVENASVAKHVWLLVKRLYTVEPRLAVLRKMRLKKNNIYRIVIEQGASRILEDLGILDDRGLHVKPDYDLIRSEKNARAFLQGCFLASGSVNSPRTANYHLEISVSHQELADSIRRIMDRFFLSARITERKSLWVVYIKAGDKIGDFLRLIDASNALLQFEDQRISRDFYNQMRRLDNCELANEMKSLKAARSQVEAIERIETMMPPEQIPQKIRDAMEIRKQHPEASLAELCDEIYKATGEIISKSGMKHRMTRIREMAAALGQDRRPNETDRQA